MHHKTSSCSSSFSSPFFFFFTCQDQDITTRQAKVGRSPDYSCPPGIVLHAYKSNCVGILAFSPSSKCGNPCLKSNPVPPNLAVLHSIHEAITARSCCSRRAKEFDFPDEVHCIGRAFLRNDVVGLLQVRGRLCSRLS